MMMGNDWSERAQIEAESYVDDEYYGEDGQEDEEEETLSDAEAFHYLLYSDTPDGEWEEIHEKIQRGARPKT